MNNYIQEFNTIQWIDVSEENEDVTFSLDTYNFELMIVFFQKHKLLMNVITGIDFFCS